ncbi:MAG: alpha-hydroxy acid oxidase [Actinomycetota bacterium]
MLENLRQTMRFRRLTLDSVERKLERAANIDDLRRIAKGNLPGGVFDYIDGAAEDEEALARSIRVFDDVLFRPRVMRDMTSIDTSTTLLGKPIPFPFALSPTGFTRIADPQGELAVARVAASRGLPYTLSTLGTRSIEEVAAVSGGPKWFQVYVWKDRGLVKEMIGRAAAAGYETIVITVDFATLGRRERDVRRGFTLPPKLGLDTIVDGMRHPRWTLDFARSEPIKFANVVGTGDDRDGTDAVALGPYVAEQLDPSLSWADIEVFRDLWPGTVMVKGVQDVEDAKIAADIGIDAVALSNHGGRQLDASPAPFELLPETVDAIGDTTEVLVDGGIRRGADIVKALCLGATACMGGRAYLYGLGAGGERGVEKALGFLHDEFDRTMKLIGANRIGDLGPDYLRPS